jgi:hypothetical protein
LREEQRVAIDDLPLPVVNFLNAIGVEWPYINEDQLMKFASLVREFSTAVETTHQDATTALAMIGKAYQSGASETMLNGWERLSATHVTQILDGCAVLADALDAAAGYIVAQKVEAIATLVGMAAAFVADQAAAVVTFGIAEAAVPLIVEGAEKLVDSLIMDLEQYIIGEVMEAAAKPLFAKVEAALTGLDWSQSGADPIQSTGFELDAPTTRAQALLLRQHAATMRQHAAAFAAGVQGLNF